MKDTFPDLRASAAKTNYLQAGAFGHDKNLGCFFKQAAATGCSEHSSCSAFCKLTLSLDYLLLASARLLRLLLRRCASLMRVAGLNAESVVKQKSGKVFISANVDLQTRRDFPRARSKARSTARIIRYHMLAKKRLYGNRFLNEFLSCF